MKTTGYILSLIHKCSALILFSLLLLISSSAQDVSSPVVSQATIVLDTINCEEVLAHAITIAEDYTITSEDNTTTTHKQELLYTWSFADSIVFESRYPEATLPVPVDSTTLKLVVSNKFNSEATDAISLPSWGVRAEYSLSVRDREIPHEVSMPTALSAPVDVEITNKSKGDYTVSEWTMGNLTRLFDKDPVYQFQTPGEYRISLTVTNEFSGCSHSDSTEVVYVTDADIRFPDAFTPNGDGMNDEFRPAYKSIKKYKLSIYNRWGRRIFSTSDPEKGWNGKNGNTEAAEGVYIYICEAEAFERGVSFTRKGTVTLLR